MIIDDDENNSTDDKENASISSATNAGAGAGLVIMCVTGASMVSNAASEAMSMSMSSLDTSSFSSDLTPENFRPVCPTSDTLYRFLQSAARVVVGDESFVRFGPLIAEGLLRVRLELCVVESFVNEAAIPFIEKNGVSWVLPLHETVETFLAGTIFGLASTFILVGSTKLITVIFTYSDFLVGAPFRIFGGIAYDRARGKPITWDIGVGKFKTRIIGPKDKTPTQNDQNQQNGIASQNSDLDFSNVNPILLPIVLVTGTIKLLGYSSKFVRQIVEGIDLFIGRYLTLLTTGYIGIKFLHYKVFPDFPTNILPGLPSFDVNLPHLIISNVNVNLPHF